MTPVYSAPSHSGTQVPYETILLHAWLVVRGANCALRDPARLRENLYQAFERTFTHADGIFNAHSGMASCEMQNDEIARMVRAVGDERGTLLEKAAREAVDRCMSAAMGPSRLWHRAFPGMVLNMLLNEIGPGQRVQRRRVHRIVRPEDACRAVGFHLEERMGRCRGRDTHSDAVP